MQKCQEFNTYGLERLKKHLVNYVIINGVLLTIDLMGEEGLSWALYFSFLKWTGPRCIEYLANTGRRL
ncbi:hypothetical protein RINTHH_590 [Richelia intracellularis HH01]|jgi:hypothetical protein|uniref:2TM domain-containing protein n=1 Tax=Richelia intracellularis HH01 TaxID=1165094 RepID=M1WQ84_9NOST|nr:hypothetical protein RINTHH_590 [Richelia intracellularis HH01]